MNLPRGRHVVRFVWINDQGTTNVQIKEMFVRNRYDLDRSGLVNDIDVQFLDRVKRNFPLIDVNDDGYVDLKDQVDYLNIFLTKDLDADGDVDLSDTESPALYQELLNQLDIDRNGLIKQADKDRLNAIIISIYQMDRLENSDLNKDGEVNSQDVNIATDIFENFVDINRDDTVDEKDLIRIDEIIAYKGIESLIGGEEWNRADINDDGVVDHVDSSILEATVNLIVSGAYDITGLEDGNPDGFTDEKDVQEMLRITDLFRPTIARMQRADINGDGYVDEVDRVTLLESIRNARDINDDGRFDQRDKEIIRQVLDWNIQLGTTPLYNPKVDIDNNGLITENDFTILDRAVQYFRDVNGDGVIDLMDIGFTSLFLNVSEYEHSDFNNDQKVTQADFDMIEEAIIRYDLNGDGFVSSSDVTMLDDILDMLIGGDLSLARISEHDIL